MDRRIEAFNITLLPEWEKKIDEEIYKLYGLSKEEIKIIEKSQQYE